MRGANLLSTRVVRSRLQKKSRPIPILGCNKQGNSCHQIGLIPKRKSQSKIPIYDRFRAPCYMTLVSHCITDCFFFRFLCFDDALVPKRVKSTLAPAPQNRVDYDIYIGKFIESPRVKTKEGIVIALPTYSHQREGGCNVLQQEAEESRFMAGATRPT